MSRLDELEAKEDVGLYLSPDEKVELHALREPAPHENTYEDMERVGLGPRWFELAETIGPHRAFNMWIQGWDVLLAMRKCGNGPHERCEVCGATGSDVKPRLITWEERQYTLCNRCRR